MKVNLLDAGILHKFGHHYEYNLRLVKHLVALGHDVTVYGYAGIDDEVVEAFSAHCAVQRIFRINQYTSSYDYDWLAPELVQYQSESETFAADLREVRPADLWIWSTVEPQHVRACVLAGVTDTIVGSVYWEPDTLCPQMGTMLWRDALLSASSKLNFTLASVETELRHSFTPLRESVPFAVLPQPVEGNPSAMPKTAMRRVGFFGHQRDEKGAKVLPPLIERLLQHGFQVTLQNSNPEFTRLSAPGLETLGFVDDLATPIARCDFVVLPYDIVRYKGRGSGVLVDCLALGVPVTAPIGTLPARTIERHGVGPLFSAVGPDQIFNAVTMAYQNYAHFASMAAKTARTFANLHGVARHAAALLSIKR